MPWASRLLRGDRVWVKINPRGEPAAGPDGRVEIRYRTGGKIYRASTRNLEVDPEGKTISDAEAGGPGGEGAANAPGGTAQNSGSGAIPKDALIVYTDGACTGNPGPMGVGVVILDGKERREVSEFLGHGTNNIAELTAIVRALELCPRDRTVVVHSDSSYALGLLGKGWKAKANQELVEQLRALAREFKDLRLVKVAGHAGVSENERCDELARMAIVKSG
ncbi:MAG TPA: ribonuclease H [Polyangia bacterium]|nr:ribonuclease H [Polyangia bacterium]